MDNPNTPPEFIAVLGELDAGLFEKKISTALAQVALAVVNAERKDQKGKLTIELAIERIGEGAQISMDHTLTYSRPTQRGKINETNKTTTLLYVGKGGSLTVTPDTQLELIKKTPREVV